MFLWVYGKYANIIMIIYSDATETHTHTHRYYKIQYYANIYYAKPCSNTRNNKQTKFYVRV